MGKPVFNFPEDYLSPKSREAKLLSRLDPARLPEHLAVIMDGNGRWAARRGLPRVEGHRRGAQSVREIIENCARLGIKVLTIYAFSSENWKRPKSEIDTLMRMGSEFLRNEVDKLVNNNIKFYPIGRWEELSETVVNDLKEGIAKTSSGTGMTFQVALNYGGRVEILDACRRVAADCVRGDLHPEKIEIEHLAKYLYSPNIPDPDLLIRTSGEFRISNFLLWELAYSEIYVTDTLWPDFRLRQLLEALIDFQRRERRFGGLGRKVT